jgi:hypothetical protein
MALSMSSKQYPYHYQVNGVWKSLWVELGITPPVMVSAELDSRGIVIPMFQSNTIPSMDPEAECLSDYRNYWVNTIGYSAGLVDEVINNILNPQPVYSVHDLIKSVYGITVGTYLAPGRHSRTANLVNFALDYKSMVMENFPYAAPELTDSESWDLLRELENQLLEKYFSSFHMTKIMDFVQVDGGSGGENTAALIDPNYTLFMGATGFWRMDRIHPYVECMYTITSFQYPSSPITSPDTVINYDGPVPTIPVHYAGINAQYLYPESYNIEDVNMVLFAVPPNAAGQYDDLINLGLQVSEKIPSLYNFVSYRIDEADVTELFDSIGLVGSPNNSIALLGNRYSTSNVSNFTDNCSALGNSFTSSAGTKPVATDEDIIGYAVVPTRFSNLQIICESFSEDSWNGSLETIKYVIANQVSSLGFITTTHEIANTFEVLYSGDPTAVAKIQEVRLEAERPIAWCYLKEFDIPDRCLTNLKINSIAGKAGEDLGSKILVDDITFKQADNKYIANTKKREVIYMGEEVTTAVDVSSFGLESVGGSPFIVTQIDGDYYIKDNSSNTLTEEQSRWVLVKSTDWSLDESVMGDVDSVYDYFFNQGDLSADEVISAITDIDSTDPYGYTTFSPSAFVVNGYPTMEGLTSEAIARFLIVAKGVDKKSFEDAMASTLMLASAPFKYSSLI